MNESDQAVVGMCVLITLGAVVVGTAINWNVSPRVTAVPALQSQRCFPEGTTFRNPLLGERQFGLCADNPPERSI